MKIDISKLKNAVKKPNGEVVAQCPACDAAGGDHTGNHLIVFPDGRFGCVAHQGDKNHNKEILKLAGADDGAVAETHGKVKVRAYKIAKATVIQPVSRRTLEELGYKRKESPLVRSRADSDGSDAISQLCS